MRADLARAYLNWGKSLAISVRGKSRELCSKLPSRTSSYSFELDRTTAIFRLGWRTAINSAPSSRSG